MLNIFTFTPIQKKQCSTCYYTTHIQNCLLHTRNDVNSCPIYTYAIHTLMSIHSASFTNTVYIVYKPNKTQTITEKYISIHANLHI